MNAKMSGTVERRVVPKVVAHVLAARGMAADEMAGFLYPDYDGGLHNPFLLTDMDAAVDRILLAAERGERVVVYGDYDIDGITASAVMIEALEAQGIRASSYIPDRFEEGYGINQQALEKLKAEGANLVVSVDCGITSVAEAQWAREHGMDLVITDHHAVPEVIPEAVAVVNPKRPGDGYPCKDLAGVGVAFKVAQALQQRTGKPAAGQEKWLLDLVALGTVCDVVPLVGENRVLVSYGLRVLRRTRRVGLAALSNVGGVDMAGITSHHLGFVFGPRMNAAGRLEHAACSLELMQTTDEVRAAQIAGELDELNRQRRATQEAIFAEADQLAGKYENDPVLVLADKGWSHGVVGIAASKLVETWGKPVLVAQVMGDETKGSARSTGGFNLVEALRSNSELLTKFGGHFFAAGFTLPTDKLEDLRRGLCDYFRESGAGEYVAPEDTAELGLNGLDDVGLDMLDDLELLEPHGNGNPRPALELGGVILDEVRPVGSDRKHLRMVLRDKAGRRLVGIGFGLASKYPDLAAGSRVVVRGELNKNEFQGNVSPQIVVRGCKSE